MKHLSFFTLSLAFCTLCAYGQYKGTRINLGTAVNSGKNTDSAPVVTYDGKTMFFKRSVNGAAYDYDIYTSVRGSDGQWSAAVPLAELNNDKISEVEYVYPDGKTMIVCGTFNGESGIFYAFLRNGKWGGLQHISIGREADANEDNLNLTLNSRQNVMIISIHGDLYLSFLENGQWSAVKEITALNTDGYEYTPFLDYDDKTLYIAGTGYGSGNGEADIWMVRRTDDTWLNWSAPEKAAGSINTDGWDSFFYISPAKDYVYVYSLEEGGGDILTIKTEKEPEPAPALADPVADPVVAVVPGDEHPAGEAAVINTGETEDTVPAVRVNRTAGSLNEQEDILVYPNPCRGQFSLVLHNSDQAVFSQVTILDACMKTLITTGTAQKLYSFDLSAYEGGIYYVRIQYGGKTSTKRVVVEK